MGWVWGGLQSQPEAGDLLFPKDDADKQQLAQQISGNSWRIQSKRCSEQPSKSFFASSPSSNVALATVSILVMRLCFLISYFSSVEMCEIGSVPAMLMFSPGPSVVLMPDTLGLGPRG
jgi:hypothetical protein